ncbi:hypothetical protein GOP47_0018451 [Adiantum capillus-veneris]|uniref:Uncharacterized protein n=1 Tax=Adiantum capillus-veneris TaxID=13818 RepID=A0A9D4Z9N0_ADICA|nr:hypothetical protein GOP47_0018451 [Adiantum capillus-veneris]
MFLVPAAASFEHIKYWDKNKVQREGNNTRKNGALCGTALELPEKFACKDSRKYVTNSESPFVLNLHHTKNSNIIVDCDVEELCLEYQHLKSMLIFGNLSSLRKLFLSGNEFVALEGLENCTLLEELVLEDNCINQVKLEICSQALWKLELGRNNLTSCVEFNVFNGLTQLSIEKNNIESLKACPSKCITFLFAI